jgi:hypothetical protein
MADDDRPDAPDGTIAEWLEVEPLDDVTRRRLVSNALRGSEQPAAPTAPTAPTRSPARAWRWVAAAAAVVVVVGGIALVAADGGNDSSQVASRDNTALAPKSFEQALTAAPDVGDFGNLDDAANLRALRRALDHPSRAASKAAGAPQAVPGSSAADTAGDAAGDVAGSTTQGSSSGCLRGATGTVVAQGRGTLDGRPVVVVLLEGADGKRSVQAVFLDACEGRDLSGSG